jgi:hypothetical protein
MDRHRQEPWCTPTAIALSVLLVAACASAPIASPSGAIVSVPPSPSAVLSPSSAPPTPTPEPPAPDRNPAAYVEGAPYSVTIDPADFVAVVDSPYWPMIPGTTTVFEGDGERIVVEVTGYTKMILGVTATVVRDTAYAKGKVIEDTFDWYAQDRAGNVWYFGEDTTEFENGKPVSTAGSWEAGVDGALPGIVMLADPQVGDIYRNEFYAGEAEDLSKVIELGGTITVPAGSYSETILTEDWTPLEPDQLERKTYAPGVGQVAEGPIDDPTVVKLVEISQP